MRRPTGTEERHQRWRGGARGQARQKPPLPQLELLSLYEEEPSGRRPQCLGEPAGTTRAGVAADRGLDVLVPLVAVGGVQDRRCSQCPRSPALPDLLFVLFFFPATQLVEQLVEVPVPESVTLARGTESCWRRMVPGRESHAHCRAGQSIDVR